MASATLGALAASAIVAFALWPKADQRLLDPFGDEETCERSPEHVIEYYSKGDLVPDKIEHTENVILRFGVDVWVCQSEKSATIRPLNGMFDDETIFTGVIIYRGMRVSVTGAKPTLIIGNGTGAAFGIQHLK